MEKATGVSTKWNPVKFGKGKLQELRSCFREGGIRLVIKRFGWKLFAVFFAYYLVRDLTLYVLIPYLIARHFL